jgi:hypothetical protein
VNANVAVNGGDLPRNKLALMVSPFVRLSAAVTPVTEPTNGLIRTGKASGNNEQWGEGRVIQSAFRAGCYFLRDGLSIAAVGAPSPSLVTNP